MTDDGHDEGGAEAVGAGAGALAGAGIGAVVAGPPGAVVGGIVGAAGGAIAGEAMEGDEEAGAGIGAGAGTVAGAALGGVVAGPPGAVVGGAVGAGAGAGIGDKTEEEAEEDLESTAVDRYPAAHRSQALSAVLRAGNARRRTSRPSANTRRDRPAGCSSVRRGRGRDAYVRERRCRRRRLCRSRARS